MQKSAKRWKIRESDFDVFWRVCQGLSPCKIFWKSVNRRLRNSMLKKRTFFVSGFLLERICGFFQNFFQTYLGSSNIFKTIFHSPRCNRLEMASVLVKICQFFFLVFLIFLAQNAKIRKIWFSKIFSSHWDGWPIYHIFCHISYRFCAILQNKTWLVITNAASKWPKSPTRPRVSVILATLEFKQKPLIEYMEMLLIF